MSPVIPFGRKGGEKDMAKLIVAFRNFANAPHTFYVVSYFCNCWNKNNK